MAPAGETQQAQLNAWIERVAAALVDGDAQLVTQLGGHRERTAARLWRGRVLVDWEVDETAGGCLVRPELLRRLGALHADLQASPNLLRIRASGRVLEALSPAHRELVQQLGGPARVELNLELRSVGEAAYRGQETYLVRERGQRAALLTLVAEVQARPPGVAPASPRSSPAPR